MIGILTSLGLSQRVAGILAPLIGLAVVLALCAALWARGNGYRAERDVARANLAKSEAQHAVTIASLDALAAEMQNMVRDGEMRESRLEAALSEARAAGDDLRKQAAEIIAEGGSETTCLTPRAVLRSRGL